MQKLLLETQVKLSESLKHIDLLTTEHKEAQKQKEDSINSLTQQLRDQKRQNSRLVDQKNGANRRYE